MARQHDQASAAITLLRIKALPKPIDHKKWVEIQYSCAKCGGLGKVRITNAQWREMVDELIPGYFCAKCGESERIGSEKLNQEKVGKI